MNTTDLTLATAALQRMYDNYEQYGGVSPDTRDENAAVARAIGIDPIEWTYQDGGDVLNDIWEASCTGIDIPELAALHVAALAELHQAGEL